MFSYSRIEHYQHRIEGIYGKNAERWFIQVRGRVGEASDLSDEAKIISTISKNFDLSEAPSSLINECLAKIADSFPTPGVTLIVGGDASGGMKISSQKLKHYPDLLFERIQFGDELYSFSRSIESNGSPHFTRLALFEWNPKMSVSVVSGLEWLLAFSVLQKSYHAAWRGTRMEGRRTLYEEKAKRIMQKIEFVEFPITIYFPEH